MASEDWLRGEIERLRNWRHNDVTPALAALAGLAKLVESFEGRTAALQERLTKVEEDVRAMATADEIGAATATALARQLKEQRVSVFTRRQRGLGYLAVVAAVVAAGVEVAKLLGA